jgi:hypothetical protein
VFDVEMGTSLKRDDVRFFVFWVVGFWRLIVGGHSRYMKSCLSDDYVCDRFP